MDVITNGAVNSFLNKIVFLATGPVDACSFSVAMRWNDLVDDITVPINRAPKSMLLAGDTDHYLIEMPDVVPASWLAA